MNDQNKDTCDKDICEMWKCISSTMSSRQPNPKTFLFIKKLEIHVYSHDVPGFFATNFCIWIRASLKSKDLGTTKKLYEEKICWERNIDAKVVPSCVKNSLFVWLFVFFVFVIKEESLREIGFRQVKWQFVCLCKFVLLIY